jgi:hypothetical protein
MVRVVIENILLFLLPTALYLAYMMLVRKADGSPQQVLDEAPLVWLFVGGLGVIAATFLIYGSMKDGTPGQVYEPPVFKDGKIIPGRVK